MAKTINIQDVKIKEFSISKNDGKGNVSLVYSLLDAGDKEWNTKRVQLNDFTMPQKKNIQKVLTFLIDKIKLIEEI